jgi:NTE family protein
MSGRFKAFDSRRREIDPDAVLASAAIPTLFRSVHTRGGTYWDGLFSQNPPVRELLDAAPDELWVIQINPQERSAEPKTVSEIADRRNELAGNLSLYQELHFIEKVDTWLDEGILVGDRYRPITVRVLEMSRSRLSSVFGAASKLNRDPLFIRKLVGQGLVKADEFLAALEFERAWRSGDASAVEAYFSADCEISDETASVGRRSALTAADHHPGAGEAEASTSVGEWLAVRLARDVQVDLTRKQIAGDRVTWTVRTTDRSGARTSGLVEARFAGGKVTSVRVERLPDRAPDRAPD